ncbi:hypothetical protein GGI04_004834 [Coemansia thaxteri]|uniref:Uncharacterized protein n=1 Tax=Coemansia thaxteri TaxID=2663907 RepID=A0A9W8EDG6_9FUNG|nr:hypothetical protein GGI04_004834 [Coemansia thaxteri]KAJ1999559.1 hypothetical protein H4R26_005009 [Coemansia thaxteri]
MESSGGLPYADFKLGKDHYTIATQLTPEDFAFLKTFPTIISLPPPYTNWIVVHGGLDPSKPLMQQSAEDIMITRNIDSSGPTSETKSGSAWFELWATKMATLTQGGNSPTGGADIDFSKIQFEKVIYGHDAGRALQLHPLTKGLDSRCVYGGALTAFVLPGETTFSVTCPDYDGSVKDD